MSALPDGYGRLVGDALQALGVRNLVLALHDACFPGDDDEDVGRGSPYSGGASRFLAFVRDLGFGGIQLGPQGITSESNPSPYDGTLFSKSPLSIALRPLTDPEAWGGLLSEKTLAGIVTSRPGADRGRVQYRYAYAAQRQALREAFEGFQRARRGQAGPARRLAEHLASFRRRHDAWLVRDALYGPLCREHGAPHWREWTREGAAHPDQRLWNPTPGEEAWTLRRRRELRETHGSDVDLHAFCQLLAHEQHVGLRERARGLGLKLYGDLQVGFSEVDVWSYQGLLLHGYVMGAPPSRTNPEGQPWNYAVLDPDQFFSGSGRAPGPALGFQAARLDKMFAEFDGLRIDHPHGLVCPWVYQAGGADPLRAVQRGARLFSSPNLPDHPALARFAIVAPEQLDTTLPRYADDWVRELTLEQVERYAVLFDVIVATARANGRQVSDLVCEVLSTQPLPLRKVLEHHGLGRFRVTQKADLRNRADVYRGENAGPADWIMVGNHDTPSLWGLLAGRWRRADALREQAEYLAWRLGPNPEDRAALAMALASDTGALARAKLADLFVGPAQNVMIFFTDLLGLEETYNVPGTVSDDNWSLRVPADFRRHYRGRLAADRALDLPRALALAIRGRGPVFAAARRDLLLRLEEIAEALRRSDA